MMHDDDDWDDSDDDGYVPCPYCKKPMYEDAGYCASCDRWISREDTPERSLSAWMTIVIVVLLGLLVLGALRLF